MERNQGRMERTIPLLPCKSLGATLEFYQALGWSVLVMRWPRRMS